MKQKLDLRLGPCSLWLLVAVAGASCGDADEASLIQERVDISTVHWTFEANETEKGHLAVLLARIASDSTLVGGLVDGELIRFSEDAEELRFLLVLVATSTSRDGEIVLIALGDSVEGGVSPSYSTGIIDRPYIFEPLAIGDFDADGEADFAYCSWPEDPTEGQRIIVGLKEGEWYTIEEPEKRPGECGPGAVP